MSSANLLCMRGGVVGKGGGGVGMGGWDALLWVTVECISHCSPGRLTVLGGMTLVFL